MTCSKTMAPNLQRSAMLIILHSYGPCRVPYQILNDINKSMMVSWRARPCEPQMNMYLSNGRQEILFGLHHSFHTLHIFPIIYLIIYRHHIMKPLHSQPKHPNLQANISLHLDLKSICFLNNCSLLSYNGSA